MSPRWNVEIHGLVFEGAVSSCLGIPLGESQRIYKIRCSTADFACLWVFLPIVVLSKPYPLVCDRHTRLTYRQPSRVCARGKNRNCFKGRFAYKGKWQVPPPHTYKLVKPVAFQNVLDLLQAGSEERKMLEVSKR